MGTAKAGTLFLVREVLFFAVIALLALSAPAFGQSEKRESKRPREVYSATAVSLGGPGAGQSVGLTIYIDAYTSDAEVKRLAGVLRSKGEAGLTSELEKLQVGKVAATGSTGTYINVARSQPMEARRRIILVSNRRLSFRELRSQTRSVDYPHSWIELRVDENGNGDGEMLPACKIKFNKKKDQYEIESLGNTPVKLMNVRREK